MFQFTQSISYYFLLFLVFHANTCSLCESLSNKILSLMLLIWFISLFKNPISLLLKSNLINELKLIWFWVISDELSLLSEFEFIIPVIDLLLPPIKYYKLFSSNKLNDYKGIGSCIFNIDQLFPTDFLYVLLILLSSF